MESKNKARHKYNFSFKLKVIKFVGTYKMRNEIETKRNQRKRNETKRNQRKRNETKSTK
jgi:hypothetical protein